MSVFHQRSVCSFHNDATNHPHLPPSCNRFDALTRVMFGSFLLVFFFIAQHRDKLQQVSWLKGKSLKAGSFTVWDLSWRESRQCPKRLYYRRQGWTLASSHSWLIITATACLPQGFWARPLPPKHLRSLLNKENLTRRMTVPREYGENRPPGTTGRISPLDWFHASMRVKEPIENICKKEVPYERWPY